MNNLDNKNLESDFKEIINKWCKEHDRTYNEALEMLKEIVLVKKTIKN